MPDNSSSSSSSISPHPLLLFVEREWRLENAYRQQRLQRLHTAYQTGNAMPRLRFRLPVFRLPDGFIFCAVGLLMKALLTCSQTPNVIPPVILNGPPPHVIYNPTYTTSLPCAAYGTLPLTYEWLKNGDKLEPNSNTVIQPDGTLTLNWQNNPVEGYYQCRVRNTAGVAISNITYLQAAVINVTLKRTLTQFINMAAGQSLVLSCEHVLESIPAATMTWLTNGDNPVLLDNRVTVSEYGSLVFTYLLHSDSNLNDMTFYRCLAYNPVTKQTFGGSYYNLNVSGTTLERSEEEPELLNSSTGIVYALEGQPFQLSCIFGGLPTPIVDWILPNRSTVHNKSTLHIQSAAPSHHGNYTCLGKNINHTKYKRFQVIIDALPRVETELKEQVATRGSTVRFHCPSVGRPIPTVSWFINGSHQNENFTGDSLILVDVQGSASISCNVSNKYGYHIRSTYLLVIDEVIVATSSQGRRDGTSAPSVKTTVTTTTTTTNAGGSEGWNSPGSRGGGSSTPANKSETEMQKVSDATSTRQSLWFLITLPVALLVAGLIIVGLYCRHKRRQSYSLNDHESQRGLQAGNRDLDANGDSDDSGYDEVSRKTKKVKQVKRLSDMPEVEESYL